MNKKKTKSTYSYGELIKNCYGLASPNTMFDLNQFEGLIAQYYGRSHPQKKEKSNAAAPASPALSLSFDHDEVLLQPAGRTGYQEYVVQSLADELAFEEYVVDQDRFSSSSSMGINEIVFPMEEPRVEQEYLLDVLQPLTETPASPQFQAETAPVPSGKARLGDQKALQPQFAAQPLQPAPVETSKATETDFMEDLQSILTGQKVFDPVSKKMVEKDQLGASQAGQAKNNGAARPAPAANNEQAIFDRIAQSMQYANTFDLGSVELDNRFADFDRISELQQKPSAKKKPEPKTAPTEQVSPELKVGSAEFVQDLDIIRSQNAASNAPLEEPAASFSDAMDAGTSSTTIPEIEALDLAETAKKAAYALKQKHPSVVFTSGRRNKEDQARAMAGNVVSNRKWIEQTYVASGVRDACQKWVDDNPKKKTAAEIEQGLLEVLNKYTDAQLGVFSKHISGMAFDVQPVEGGGDIKASIRALDGLDKFLEKEGGLVRWHAQFK